VAVYDRSYRGYQGPTTSAWERALVIPRYGLREAFRPRLFAAFFTACFAMPAVFIVLLYLRHNVSALDAMEINADALDNVVARAFEVFVYVQGHLAFLVSLVVGPGLVAPDLANNGLALYLCRPMTKTRYAAGKMAVLALILSLITWVPGLLLVLLQGFLEGFSWLGSNLDTAWAIFFGSWVWILVLSFLSLAASALVRKKVLAGALVLGVFFTTGAFASVVNEALDTKLGHLIDLGGLILTVWQRLFGREPHTGMSLATALVALGAVCALCALVLARKLRAYEVVR
jgi:ABC-2 type transport system permease protein